MQSLFLLFIVVPIAEMWVLIQVGSRIGATTTIALVFLTAIIGLALLRQQGLSTLLKVNQRLAEGQLPADDILGGVILTIGGALLLTPGFITDAVGFACLLPPTRALMVKALIRRGLVLNRHQTPHDANYHTGGQRPGHEREGKTTIEGEFKRED